MLISNAQNETPHVKYPTVILKVLRVLQNKTIKLFKIGIGANFSKQCFLHWRQMVFQIISPIRAIHKKWDPFRS